MTSALLSAIMSALPIAGGNYQPYVTNLPSGSNAFQRVMSFATPNLGGRAPNVLPNYMNAARDVVASNSHQTKEREVNLSYPFEPSSQVATVNEIRSYAERTGDLIKGCAMIHHITFVARKPTHRGVLVPTSLPALNIALRQENAPNYNSALDLLNTWSKCGVLVNINQDHTNPAASINATGRFTIKTSGRTYTLPNYWLAATPQSSKMHMTQRMGCHLWLILKPVPVYSVTNKETRKTMYMPAQQANIFEEDDEKAASKLPRAPIATEIQGRGRTYRWQFVPYISNTKKPCDMTHMVEGGKVGTCIYIGVLMRALNGVQLSDSAYARDAKVAAGLIDDKDFLVAEQSLPRAEVLLC
jgi:hypothetical protein